jgi:hypothetical protein
MPTIDINAEIAERVMGWEVDRDQRTYRDPHKDPDAGSPKPLPDFLLSPHAHNSLRETMKNRGFALKITHHPLDWKKSIGKTVTAQFSRHKQSFQATKPEESLAVCVAALKAHGWSR